MPTVKKRINLSVDDSLYDELEHLKQLKGAPSMAAVVIELAREALETQEDLYFSKLASEREKEKTVAHDRIWKKRK